MPQPGLEKLLLCLKKLLASGALIEDILIALESKRETLEEKIIKRTLNQIAGTIGALVRELHLRLSERTFDIDSILSIKLGKGEPRVTISTSTGKLMPTGSGASDRSREGDSGPTSQLWIEAAADLAEQIEHKVAELKKMIDYDLNFLEQYYEHEFCASLLNEHKFAERLQLLIHTLPDNSSTLSSQS